MGKVRNILVLAFLAALAQVVQCQTITGLNLPRYLCSGASYTVVFGQSENSGVEYRNMSASLGQSDQFFLPDGRDCGESGCAYQSSVEFVEFGDNDTIHSLNDIKYLRVNIEHSYLADLYMRLICPNQQYSTLLKFGGQANSDCASHIPPSGRNWLTGNNASPGAFLGVPIDAEDPYEPCNPNQYANRPGVGWNYCWSDNDNSGYQYTSGGGILYRMSHTHNNIVDSSNVAAGTNFYHPDQSFSQLIGCPLNGNWTIEVIDGYEIDNGYVFEWEIVLDDALIPVFCEIDSFAIEGMGVTRVNDSTFTITAPATLAQDTTVLYRFLIYNDCGDVIDTTAAIQLLAPRETTVNAETIENDLPYVFMDTPFYDSVSDHRFHMLTTRACDSTIHFNLHVWYNSHLTLDTLVCTTRMPVTWHGYDFYSSDTLQFTLHDIHGADSVVELRMHVVPQDTIEQYRAICNGGSYTWINGTTYYDTYERPIFVIPGGRLCDSVLRLNLVMASTAVTATMSISPNPVPMSENTVTLKDVSGSRNRIWYFLDRTDTLCTTTFPFPSGDDSVQISLKVYDQRGCIDSTTGVVYRDKTALWVPNAFTPDEPTNSLFLVKSNYIAEGEVVVYDRKGLFVTSFDILTGSWDGTANGHPCPQGSYVWKITYISAVQPGISKVKTGTVLLLR